ncbi:hypothetical protein CRYUN_Cryun07bG0138500 [Craigia yunnanensis]
MRSSFYDLSPNFSTLYFSRLKGSNVTPCTRFSDSLRSQDLSSGIQNNQGCGVANSLNSPKRKRSKKRIVITGMGLVSVFGSDIDNFYNKLLEGESGITQIDRFDASNYSARFAGQIRDFLLKDTLMERMTAVLMIAGAANNIRRGEADIMVAGGTEAAIMSTGIGGFIACRALSQRNDKPRGLQDPGTKIVMVLLWEKALIMETLEHAVKRGANVIAEYLGGGVTCDAHHMTDPRSDGLGVSSCITKSVEDAGVSPEESRELI